MNNYINGVNLGNWLVLEKWMNPGMFEGTTAEDEYYLPTQLSPEVYEARIRLHRHEYITERDFATIRSYGMNAVRIPVPYFIMGDCPPFIGCIEELDKAFAWAKKYNLQVLIDLHTVPGGQNGFDNGGISGVCKWAQQPESVEFALQLLEKLSERYATHPNLWGIGVLNEPITERTWKLIDVQNRYKPADPELAAGSAPISMEFLRTFYVDAYHRIRRHLPEDKVIVIHDGFELTAWKDFMQEEEYKNVVLDTHQYLMSAEMYGCEQSVEGYVKFIEEYLTKDIVEMKKYFPVICGEWSLFNSYGTGIDTSGGLSPVNGVEAHEDKLDAEERKQLYSTVANAQLEAWGKINGHFYWNYKLLLDTVNDPGWIGWDCWDLGKSVSLGWYPVKPQK